jgi:tetratricopeptide (TPR) repeat protein
MYHCGKIFLAETGMLCQTRRLVSPIHVFRADGFCPPTMDLTTELDNSVAIPAEQFRHYRLGRHLGAGGFGVVREAWDDTLQRRVAIKRLSTAGLPGHPGSLLQEARLAASLEHPAFVKIYSIEADGAGHAIVMELVSGLTLRELIARGPIATAQVFDLVAQTAAAMQAAHGRGLVHGDLKPSNLMVDDAGKLRILDLGLAFHDDAQATTSVMQLDQQGTIAYMAPECLLGKPTSRLSDVYALGVLFYEMICGARPFANLSGLALAAAHMQSSSSTWVFPASTPAPLIELIRSMTARQPEQRMTGMEAIGVALAACRDGLPVPHLAAAPAPESAPESTPPRMPRHTAMLRRLMLRPRQAWLGGALVLALGLGGVLAVDHARTSAPVFSRAATVARALHALESFDQTERLEAARADFAALLANDPDNAAAVAGMSLVDSFRYAGDTQDETWLRRADAAAQQALRLEPALALSHVARAWVLTNQGQREQALAAVEQALRLEPDNYFAALGKITFLTQLRRYDEANAWGEAMLRRHPRQRVFADALGTVHFLQGRYKEAEQAFRVSIQLQPDSSVAYANLNQALMRQGRVDEALQVVQQGLRVRPSAALYTNLGNALFQRADYVGAASAFERAVTPPAGSPNRYLGWANLGDTLLWIPGREAQARSAYAKARELLAPQLARAPGDVTLLSRMGLYAARSGDAAGAMDMTAKALAMAPKSPDVHFRAGLAYELLHHRELALAALAQAKRFGYPASAIDAEPDFVALRRDARYQPH